MKGPSLAEFRARKSMRARTQPDGTPKVEPAPPDTPPAGGLTTGYQRKKPAIRSTWRDHKFARELDEAAACVGRSAGGPSVKGTWLGLSDSSSRHTVPSWALRCDYGGPFCVNRRFATVHDAARARPNTCQYVQFHYSWTQGRLLLEPRSVNPPVRTLTRSLRSLK
jgi:hypothetical protein